MLTTENFIQKSLELNLFFLRIQKEHATFLEGGFTPANADRARQADVYKSQYELLLRETIEVSNGIISPLVLQSGEIVTPFTLNAERVTQFYTGIPIDSGLTQLELNLQPGVHVKECHELERKVRSINERAIVITNNLIQFKIALLNDVLSCRIFTVNYPLLIEHILREARLFVTLLTRLQTNSGSIENIIEQEAFWNRIMSEHAFFIRGLLDPTEEELITVANNFGNQFNELFRQAEAANLSSIDITKVTLNSLNATRAIKDFKATGTQGLLNCSIKSIILPLLGDHVLREASHYLRLLETQKGIIVH
ncbi:MAG TPA: DUF2935 domain-containing protein [Patescibacteria group bacterium]|nr:DUF2935 domain-containing protein [Patescibacteria group bacterium]